LRNNSNNKSSKKTPSQKLRSLSSSSAGHKKSGKSARARKQEAVSTVMSSGLPSNILEKQAYGLIDQ
jgi:hypothetical protein